MFDDLLGRTALKERIESLEEEKRHLEDELEAEAERRADAQTARQEAERESNRLEDRIAQLEDRIDRLEGEEATLAYRAEEAVFGGRLGTVLDRLESIDAGSEGLHTAYVADGHDLPGSVREALGERAALVSRAAPCLVVADDAGMLGATLSVPLPPEPFAEWDATVQFDRSWFEPREGYTLALVRSDLFAMGGYRGDERTAFHGFDSQLKSQHSKGGFSQARFERIRDEQIENHVDRCRAALAERDAETLYLVGESSVVGQLADVADATATSGATGDPEDALDRAFEEFWTVQLRTI